MDVRCERCQTEYELDDGSVSETGTEVQCTACNHTFVVKRAATATSDADPSPPPAEWLLETSDGQFHRFRNLTSLQKWIIERKVTREDKISRTGHAWRRLGDIVELGPFFDVVDEADRAKAAALAAQQLKQEAAAARRTPPRPAAPPAPAPIEDGPPAYESLSPELDMMSPGPDTHVVRVRSGKTWKLLLGLGIAAGVAWAGITRLGSRPFRLPAPGTAAKAPAPEAQPTPPAAAPTVAAPPPPATAAPPPPTGAAVPPAADTPGRAPTTAPAAPAPTTPEPPRATEVASPAAPAKPPATYASLVGAADRALENGATARAQKLYAEALKLEPNGAEALAGLGYAALDKGRTAQAFTLFRKALQANPRHGPAIYGLAEAHRATGDRELALANYRRYLDVDPTGPDASAARRQIKTLELAAPAAP